MLRTNFLKFLQKLGNPKILLDISFAFSEPKLNYMKRSYYIVALIMLTFFVISFLTNIIGPLSPEFIKDFKLSDLLAGALPFAFFIAYGVMSIPSSMLVQRYNEKKIMVAAFFVAFA